MGHIEIETLLDDFELFATNRQAKYGTLLAFSITNSCPLKCAHCIVNANSSNDKLSSDDFHRCLVQLSNLSNIITQISVTGGEPFYVPQKLKVFSDFCSDQNIRLGVVTSAHWAADFIEAIDTMKMYPGISHYSISTDKHHLRFVPIANIKNAYFAAKQLNKKVVIRITGESELSVKQDDNLRDIYDFVTDEKEVVFQRLLPFGRAKKSCKKRFQYTKEPPLMPCFSNAPVIRENGFVGPCCGAIISLNGQHPMVLGNVLDDDLPSILSRTKSNWLFNYIRLWGLHDFIEIIKESELRNKLSERYLEGDDVCTTCCELFADKEIANFLENMSKTLAFRLKVAVGINDFLHDDRPLSLLRELYGL